MIELSAVGAQLPEKPAEKGGNKGVCDWPGSCYVIIKRKTLLSSTMAKTPAWNQVPAGFSVSEKAMTKKCDITGWLSLDDAAISMQTTKVHLLMLVKRGLVRGREQDGEWFVDPAALLVRPEADQVFSSAHCKDHGGCGGCS